MDHVSDFPRRIPSRQVRSYTCEYYEYRCRSIESFAIIPSHADWFSRGVSTNDTWLFLTIRCRTDVVLIFVGDLFLLTTCSLRMCAKHVAQDLDYDRRPVEILGSHDRRRLSSSALMISI